MLCNMFGDYCEMIDFDVFGFDFVCCVEDVSVVEYVGVV